MYRKETKIDIIFRQIGPVDFQAKNVLNRYIPDAATIATMAMKMVVSSLSATKTLVTSLGRDFISYRRDQPVAEVPPANLFYFDENSKINNEERQAPCRRGS